MSTIVCIGSGNMGAALMKGACSGGAASGACVTSWNIFFTDVDTAKARTLAAELKANVIESNIEAVKKGDFIFLAVKPQILPQVLAEIAAVTKERLNGGNPPVFVSMAAGWSIAKIKAAISEKLPVARIMPNTPALIGKGMIALAASPEVPKEKVSELERILGGAGVVDILDENYMNAATGLSGSGPAFVYMFIEALADGGVRAGLPMDKALRYAAQTVFGASAMVLETGKHPGELKDMVTSPGGTTIAGLATFEDGAFRGSVIKAVEAAWKRAGELS